jgi:hypothetical protein
MIYSAHGRDPGLNPLSPKKKWLIVARVLVVRAVEDRTDFTPLINQLCSRRLDVFNNEISPSFVPGLAGSHWSRRGYSSARWKRSC